MRYRPGLRVFKFGTANCTGEEHYYLCYKPKEASNCSGSQGTHVGVGRRKRAISGEWVFYMRCFIIIGLTITFSGVKHTTDSLDLILDPQKSVKRREDLDAARKQSRKV